VSKHFYDPVYDDTFLHNKHNMKWWNSTEPLWYTASKHGLQTATVHWPGGDLANYKSHLYSYFEFNDSSSLKHKLSHIIKKFLHEHYVFIAVYDDQLDLVSHEYGIDSNEFNQTIRDLDAGLGHYIYELKQHGLYHANDFNTIILSTHGMCQVEKNIFFDQYISKYEAEILSFTSTIVHLVPIIQTKTLMDKLKRIPYVHAYLKADIPDRWHYKNNRRIGDILIVAKEGIALHMQNHVQASLLNSNLSVEEVDNFYSEVLYKAEHGYDNELESMRGMFIARGSAFKTGHASSNPIDNVDVYPLMCYLLDLKCYPNNGSMANVRTFLRSQSTMLSFKGTLLFCLYYFLYSIYF
jgi:predicted AlkP superfamily pyrophosphatase or phosphodiesterase